MQEGIDSASVYFTWIKRFLSRSAPISCGSRDRKKPRQIHGYAFVFCESFSIKISAHLFGKNRSVQVLLDFIVIRIKSGLHCCNFSFHFALHFFPSAGDTAPSIIWNVAIILPSIGFISFFGLICKVSSSPANLHLSISFLFSLPLFQSNAHLSLID